MATLQQALTRIDAICPNAWDDAAKIQWLNECEHMIQMRILDAAPEQCVTYDADTERGTVLLVPAPFDRLYVYYVIAMCDYAAHETAHYADSMALFNAALDEYAKWHQRTNGAAVPSPGRAIRSPSTPPCATGTQTRPCSTASRRSGRRHGTKNPDKRRQRRRQPV